LGNNDRDRLLVYLVKAERARLNEIKGKIKAADALYTELYQPGAASFIFGPDYAAFLERQGRLDEARIVWTSMSSQNGDTVSAEALRRLSAPDYHAPALPDVKQSMAQSLFVAATLAFSERDTEDSLACLRLSLYLDPGSDSARIFLGQVEQSVRDTAAADAAWATIPATSVQYSAATLRRIWSLRNQDRLNDADALADEGLRNRPDDLGLVVEKANILHEKDQDEAALAVLNDRIKRVGDSDFNWQAWFLQAIIYDSLDRWPDAEAAIKKARVLNANRPEILNFLGYGWINRGLNIPEGMDLIREALKANPRSGAMVDSLGWGYFKQGQYDQALNYIEQAVQMDPSDPEVNDHLGDVYKALGRNVEAGYEWQRVLSLKVSDKQAATTRKKLDDNAADLANIASQVKAQSLAAAAQATAAASGKTKGKGAVSGRE
jgi:tetratricopeptide (TPR) repeat protein